MKFALNKELRDLARNLAQGDRLDS